ncbi:hypothetical protein ACQJBY_027109 [Aegilops geniculata]
MGDEFPRKVGLKTMNLMLGMCFISTTGCCAAQDRTSTSKYICRACACLKLMYLHSRA